MRAMRALIAAVAVLVSLVVAVPADVRADGAATLTYSYGATNTSYNYRPLIITATEGGADIAFCLIVNRYPGTSERMERLTEDVVRALLPVHP